MSFRFSGLDPIVLQPGTAAYSGITSSFVGLASLTRGTLVITVVNSTGVTGAAVGLVQATSAAGGGLKVLNFGRYRACTDHTTDTWTANTTTSNAFTTSATASKVATYTIDIDPAALDTTNTFSYVGVTFGTNTNTTVGAILLPSRKASYGASQANAKV